MPNLTPNLNLKKPLLNETADIDVLNENFDKIDAEIGNMPKKDGTLQAGLNAEKVGGKTVSELAPASHTHTKSQITDFTHTHSINEITNLIINNKINTDLIPDNRINLVLNSDFRFGIHMFRRNATQVWGFGRSGDDQSLHLYCNYTTNSSYENYQSPYITFPFPGATLSLSVDMYALSVTQGGIFTEITFYDSNKQFIKNEKIDATNGVGWKRYNRNNIVVPANTYYISCGYVCLPNTNGLKAWRKAKINVGDIVYPYSTETDDIMSAELNNISNIEKQNKDSNGIYTTVLYKRADNTLIAKSELSGGTSPQYTNQTIRFYDTFNNEIHYINKSLGYDSDSDIITESIIL